MKFLSIAVLATFVSSAPLLAQNEAKPAFTVVDLDGNGEISLQEAINLEFLNLHLGKLIGTRVDS